MDTDNSVYGQYSMGSGSILTNPDQVWDKIDADEVIAAYEKSIRLDLQKSGIPLARIREFRIMDVGTGRQAIAFHRLGARFVQHYDISPQNVKKLSTFIEDHSLQDRMATGCADLVEEPPPVGEFDLVYLNGIAQHFAHVGRGLVNCMRAVNDKGYLWLYFYRSGSFTMFVIDLLRDLIHPYADLKEYFVNAVLLHSTEARRNFLVSNIMDNFFDPYVHLYTPRMYLDFVRECGFDVVSSSRLDPLGRDVDHQFAYPSVVVTCQKVDSRSFGQAEAAKLAPEKRVNQIDPGLHLSEEIMQTIASYSALKQLLSTLPVPRSVVMSLSFRIYQFLDAAPDSGRDADWGLHRDLQGILANTRELLQAEYGSRPLA